MSEHGVRGLLQLCQEALTRQGHERDAFLDEACAGNPDLRRAVEALLAEQSATAGFLATPAWTPEGPRLAAGTHLGPYEIQSFIGAGGMGEVYRARDTRLSRTVAIKVLPPALAADPDRRRRFEQEARAVSALNHPNICTLHDVGSSDGADYLVMEYVEGQTLADRLTKGPIAITQALEYATQIADALAKAHRQGIIHRDLKPGNVMLTKAGAKLLDFGLAKLRAPAAAPGVLSSLATRESSITAEGAIVGTLAYMAPEQLEGKSTDARSDIFSFGAVLYEMLTGKRAFAGESQAGVIAAILERDPPLVSSLQPLTPPALDRVVRQCLAKAPDDRPDTAHDVANELRWMRDTSGAGIATRSERARRRSLRATLAVTTGLLLLIAGAIVIWLLRPSPARPSVSHVSIEVKPADEMNSGAVDRLLTPGGSHTALAWTPDGQTLVFVGRRNGVQQLYVRRLDAIEARLLANTEGAQVPAVSPDGQSAAFWAKGAIRKVPLGGGVVTDLATGITDVPSSLDWDSDGRLFFGSGSGPSGGSGIWRIPADGGRATPITKPGEGESHRLPWSLPGGRVLLYTSDSRSSWGDEEIVAQTLDSGATKVVLPNATDARYLPTGHLVFLRRGVLFAVPFDVARLEVRGTPVPMLEPVTQALTGRNSLDVTGAGQFAIAATTGTLAWVPGPVVPYPDSVLVTVDRAGRVIPLPAPGNSYGSIVRLSPQNGRRRLAVMIRTLDGEGLWLYDLERTTLTALNRDGGVGFPVWSPDGRRIFVRWLKDRAFSLGSQPADGSPCSSVLLKGLKGPLVPSSFEGDGQHLLAMLKGEIVRVTVVDGTVQRVHETRDHEAWPELSPDGRWLAYGSNKSGRNEIYVRPYPGEGGAEPVSIDGGFSPAWNANGRELFFVSLAVAPWKHRMMAVDFAPGPPLRIGRPHVMFEFDSRSLSLGCVPVRCYDVAPDGQQFYAVEQRAPLPPASVTHIDLIENWFEELKAKVPVRR